MGKKVNMRSLHGVSPIFSILVLKSEDVCHVNSYKFTSFIVLVILIGGFMGGLALLPILFACVL